MGLQDSIAKACAELEAQHPPAEVGAALLGAGVVLLARFDPLGAMTASDQALMAAGLGAPLVRIGELVTLKGSVFPMVVEAIDGENVTVLRDVDRWGLKRETVKVWCLAPHLAELKRMGGPKREREQ